MGEGGMKRVGMGEGGRGKGRITRMGEGGRGKGRITRMGEGGGEFQETNVRASQMNRDYCASGEMDIMDLKLVGRHR